jgi:3D-(3,5/4)-trihydroxycyclohexane-1,2-dione acylhydrolase (decyclizing)
VRRKAGKGALPEPHPLTLGGIGATGTRAANRLARDADLVIVIGSRLSDFTTASKTAFQHERVRFVTINVAELDAGKHAAVPLLGDARAVLEELLPMLAGYRVGGRVRGRGQGRAGRLAGGSRAPLCRRLARRSPRRAEAG